MKITAIFFWAVIIVSSGIAAATEQQSPNKAATLKAQKMDSGKQCVTYGKILRGKLKNGHLELALKNEIGEHFRSDDIQPIKNGEPSIGMSLCALIAAMGQPEQTNKTHTKSGMHIQAIYPNNVYVYINVDYNKQTTEVTGWQD